MGSETSAGRRLVAWARAHWIPLAHLVLCAAVLAPIAARPGWPAAHDGHPLFQRVEAFRRELAAGNAWPLWAPFANNGHGMPMPLFYHRLFNTAAGLLALMLGTVAAVKVALGLALAVGAAGMVAAAEELDCPPWLRFWSGAFLLLAHYTFTNWLVRGAAAEVTAGMLVPWAIAACLRMQSGKPFGARLGATMALLFYAHVAICLYTGVLVAIAALCCAVKRRATPAAAARYLGRGLGAAVAIPVVVAGPVAAAIWLVGPEFRIDRFRVYLPQDQIASWRRLLIDEFPWGTTWHGGSIEIGRYLLAALVVVGALALIRGARVRVAPLAFLAASCLAYVGLQLPQAAQLYRAARILQILQFPWRLLVFVTPLVILLVAELARAVAASGRRWAYAASAPLAAAWVAQVVFAQAPYRATYEWMDPHMLEGMLAAGEIETGAGEFLPSQLATPEPPPRADLVRLEGCRLVSSSPDLAVLQRRPFETLELALDSPAGCSVHVNQFWTTLVRVRTSPGGRVLRAADDTTDIVLPPGTAAITIDRRGILRSIGHALRARLEASGR